jgi:hypothetical protein
MQIRSPSLFSFAALTVSLAAVLLVAAPAAAQPAKQSKAYRLLLQHGIQLQGMVTQDDVFHLSTYRDIGYTSVNWLYSNNVPNSNVAQLGPPRGFLWSRWVSDQAHLPPQGNERPYTPHCIALALVDEQNLNDDATRDKMVKLFEAARDNPIYADTVLYTNNFGGQVSDSALTDLVRRARPDMLFFDTYPFKSRWDESKPGHIGDVLPVDNLPWESELRRYRQHSIVDGIPFGVYTQTFHSEQDYDRTVYRSPSASELRFNNNVAIAFNAKWLTGFTYNTGASSLFTKPGGDSHPTPLYAEQRLVNRRLQRWSPALVRLTPIADLHNPAAEPSGSRSEREPGGAPAGLAPRTTHSRTTSDNPNFPDQTTTSILFIKGQSPAGKPNGLPIGFQADPEAPQNYSWWEAGKNDPYLRGWEIANTGNPQTGAKVNNGKPGDVIVSWFRPLDERFDRPKFKDEVYLMIVNALTDPHARSADDCTQKITLNFAFPPGMSSIEMLDPDTGALKTVKLPVVQSRNQLVLKLAGGDAALLKFADGAPFVGISKTE